MQRSDGLFSALAEVSRRDFMKLCTALAATMGLSSKAGAEMTAALTEPKRPPVSVSYTHLDVYKRQQIIDLIENYFYF